MSARRGGARGLAVAALAFLGLACGLFSRACARPEGGGFVLERHGARDGQCEGVAPSSREVVREPALVGHAAQAGCWRWRGHRWSLTEARLELMVETDLEVWVRVDGGELLRTHAGMRRERAAVLDLAPGVHDVEIVALHRGGSAYLRLFATDLRDARMGGARAPRDEEWRASREAAQRALDDASSELDVTPDASSERVELARLEVLRARIDRRAMQGLAAFVSIALASLLGWCAWRGWRGHGYPRDLLVAVPLSAWALWIRATGARVAENAWDELAYVRAGEHFIRNVELGDRTTAAWRWNMEHPPIAKWLFGIGSLFGGLHGARMLCAVLGAITAGLVFSLARSLYRDARVAPLAAGLFVVYLPPLVGHARLATLETLVVFFWSAALLAGAVWMERASRGAPAHGPAAIAAVCTVLGTTSRATCVWIVLVLACAWGIVSLRRRRIAWPWAGGVAGVITMGLVVLVWPWLHVRTPLAQLAQAGAHFARYVPAEHYAGGIAFPPPPHYFAHAFVATTPLVLLVLAGVGLAAGLGRRDRMAATLLLVVALLAPFAQGVSHVRQDLARYVVPAWIALALLAALGLEALIERRPSWRFSLLFTVAIHLGISLERIEPYPLVDFNVLSGGAPHVARTHTFEVGAWGEGQGAALDWVNAHVEDGARVRFESMAHETHARLRDGLVPVERGRGEAEYVILANVGAESERPPTGCITVHEVVHERTTIARVLRCDLENIGSPPVPLPSARDARSRPRDGR